MKRCPKCNYETSKNSAQFCANCGTKMEAVPEPAKCASCGALLTPNARFCGACGTKVETPAAENNASPIKPNQDLMLIGSFIRWNILPGQIAIRIDESDIAAYGKDVKGVSVQEGVAALFFVKGQLNAELKAGNYTFKDLGGDDYKVPSEKKGSAPQKEKNDKKGLFSRITSTFTAVRNGVSSLFGRGSRRRAAQNAGLSTRIPANVPQVTIILVRTGCLPLYYQFKDVRTENIRLEEVGIQADCRVDNVTEFYIGNLIDRKMFTFQEFRDLLEPIFRAGTEVMLAHIDAKTIENNDELRTRFTEYLQKRLDESERFRCFDIDGIERITAEHDHLSEMARKSEELYIAEDRLEMRMRFNDLLNRITDLEREQEFTELQGDNAYRNRKASIERDQEYKETVDGNEHRNRMTDAANKQEFREEYAETLHETDMRRHAYKAEEDEASDTVAHTDKMDTISINAMKNEAEREKAKEKYYEEMQFTQAQREQFDRLLDARKQINEADTAEEVIKHMHELEKAGMFRKDEIEMLLQTAELRKLDNAQKLRLAEMTNTEERTRMNEEFERERRRRDRLEKNEVSDEEEARRDSRRDKEDAYQDGRRDKEDAYKDGRRSHEDDYAFNQQARNDDYRFNKQTREQDRDLDYSTRKRDADFNHAERLQRTQLEFEQMHRDQRFADQARRLELLQNLENGNADRKLTADEAAHRHKMDEMDRNYALERDKMLHEEATQETQLKYDNEKTKTLANMTAEQIMAAHSNLSKDAAQALSIKWQAEAAANAKKYEAEAAYNNSGRLEEVYKELYGKLADTQKDEVDKIMAMANSNQAVGLKYAQMMAQNAQSMAGAIAGSKDNIQARTEEELRRAREDATANIDRFDNGINRAIESVAQMGRNMPPPYGGYPQNNPYMSQQPQQPGPAKKCPNCGAVSMSAFCETCGAKL